MARRPSAASSLPCTRPVLQQVAYGDVCARLGQRQRHLPAQPPGAARDDGDLSAQAKLVEDVHGSSGQVFSPKTARQPLRNAFMRASVNECSYSRRMNSIFIVQMSAPATAISPNSRG